MCQIEEISINESLINKMNKTSTNSDYRMRSQWEMSFDGPKFNSPWDNDSVPTESRTSHRKYPESKTYFISFWVDTDDKCTNLSVDLKTYDCTWMNLLRVERQGRYYVEGVVRYRIPKSRQWVLRTMGYIVPNGLMVSRMLYNRWESWIDQYSQVPWFEKGEKPKTWIQVERRNLKRKIDDEKMSKKRVRMELDYQTSLLTTEFESETEIDESK